MENRKVTCCKVEGCEGRGQVSRGVAYFVKGYCNTHYMRFRKHGNPEIVLKLHTGKKKHPLYNTWAKMKGRTSDPNHKSYPDYGGRGIKVCDRWQGPYGFDNFLKDMGERHPNATLDRIDNDGNYYKENCHWSTRHQQNANTSRNNETVGVGWHKQSSKWQAYIHVEGKQKNLGRFINYEDAVAARKAAEVLHGITY